MEIEREAIRHHPSAKFWLVRRGASVRVLASGEIILWGIYSGVNKRGFSVCSGNGEKVQ